MTVNKDPSIWRCWNLDCLKFNSVNESSCYYCGNYRGYMSDDVKELLTKAETAARIEEYQLGLQTGAMPESLGKPIAQVHLSKLRGLSTQPSTEEHAS